MAEGFGSGIALQDRIPGPDFARDQWLQNQRQKNIKAKGDALAESGADKYLNSVMVQVGQGKTHQRYADEQRKVVADILKAAEEAKAEAALTGQNWKSSSAFQQRYMQALTKHRDILAASENQYKMEQSAIQGLQDGTADPEAAMAFLSASRVGDNSKLTGDPYEYHTEGINDVTGLPMSSINPYQKIDLPKLIHDDLTNPKNMTHIQMIREDQGLPGFVRGALSESGLPNTEEEAKILQKQRGYAQKPTSVESIINDKVENYYREMERMVRADAIALAEADKKDFSKLKKDERMPYVKKAALERAIPTKGQKITEKMFRVPAAPRPSSAGSGANANYDVTVNYNADESGNENWSPSYKGTPEPKGFMVVDKDGNKSVIFGVADRVKKMAGENDIQIVIKDSKGEEKVTSASPENLTALRAQWGVSPFDVRNRANKDAGHTGTQKNPENELKVHPSTTGVTYSNLYKEGPKAQQAVTTPAEKPQRKHSKSKSGKDIYSDDGGKTWHYSN